ncbi:hypothetical protein ACLOAV_004636 [Pseudogymnoascus australis]
MSKTFTRPSKASPRDWRFNPPPAPGSLHAVLLSNRSRLHLHPLEWNGDHPKALDVDLRLVDGIKTQQEVRTPPRGHDSEHLPYVVRELELAESGIRDEQTRQFLEVAAHAPDLRQIVKESTLDFEYDNVSVEGMPRLLVAWHKPSDEAALTIPIWAYTDHKWMSAARRKWLTTRGKSWSFINKAIKGTKELDFDPVYVAILVSLAQMRRRNDQQGSQSYKVALFVPEHKATPSLDTLQLHTTISRPQKPAQVTSLVQYTAYVPALFLKKLENPYQFHDASLHIEKLVLPTNDPAWFIRAMRTAFNESALAISASPPARTNLKRTALNELGGNMVSQSPLKKRKMV